MMVSINSTDQCICVNDFEILASKRLSKNALACYSSGAMNGQTLRENCSSFAKWRFQPRVLRDVSSIDTTTSVLGQKLAFPVCVAPTGINRMASEDGEIDSAKAADALGTGFAMSSTASTSMEDLAALVPSVPRWFQLYVYKNKELTRNLVERAEANGFLAIMVTVDTPVLGRRYLEVREKFELPSNLSFENFKISRNKTGEVHETFKSSEDSYLSGYASTFYDPKLSWKDIDWLKSITKLPIIVKGILREDTAIEALEHGVDGILVSNHGGRQLDGVLATIDALPQVVKAVKGKCEVYLDGGVRNGGDVAKAIALGAKAVFVGRPMIWGIACDGEAGGKRVLEILRDEFELTMKLLGVRSIAELQSVPDLVSHESKLLSKM